MTANASILISGFGNPAFSKGLKLKEQLEGRNKSPSLSKSMNEHS